MENQDIEIELPDGTILEFQAGATKDQIKNYVSKNYPQHAHVLSSSQKQNENVTEERPNFMRDPWEASERAAKTVQNVAPMFLPSMPLGIGAQYLAKSIPMIGRYLPEAIGQGLSQGLYAAATASEDSNLKNRGKLGLHTGLGTGAASVLGNSLISGLSKLKPSNFFRGRLSPEELAANLRASQGTNTPLGNVTGDPKAVFLKSVASKVPLAGGKEELGLVADQISNKARNTLDKVAPSGVTGDLNDLTYSLLGSVKKQRESVKNNLYNKRNLIAEQESHVLKTPKFTKDIDENLESIKKSPLYLNDSDFRSAFNKMSGYNKTNKVPAQKSSILNSSGKPFVKSPAKTLAPSLSEATNVSNKLYSSGEKLYGKDKHLGNMYKKMALSLREDIGDSIATASPKLKKSHEIATQHFKEDIVPFLEKDISKILSKENPEKIIRDIIKPGKELDQYQTIEKVRELLPKDKQNLLGYAYLKTSINEFGEVDPKKLSKLIRSLGDRQVKALFPDNKLREQVLDFSRLTKMNPKAMNSLYDPDTGVAAIPFIQSHAAVTSPVKTAIGTLGASALNKAMSSPELRKSLVTKMINNSRKASSVSKVNTAPYVLPLIQALQSQKKKERGNNGTN